MEKTLNFYISFKIFQLRIRIEEAVSLLRFCFPFKVDIYFFLIFLLSTFYDIFYLNFIPSLTERLLLERKNFSATLIVSSSWYKNYIDTWQINRRESNLIPYRQELHKNRRFLGSQAIKAYVVFWAKEKGLGIWDFKEETNDLQKDMKINVW